MWGIAVATRWRRMIGAGVAAVAVSGAALGITITYAGADTSAYVPAQFIAKQYTEALGRMPDQPGWQSAVDYFDKNGCGAGTLATEGEAVYTSSEYTGLGYGDAAKLETLYRGALNREPDQAGFDNWTTQLDNGMAWSTVVDKFFTSSDFTALVPKICSGVVDGSGASYYFGTQPAIALPTGSSGFHGTEADLQAKLDATPSGGTVTLAQRALVPLTQPLVVPAGVTLTTSGSPNTRHYADMGRLYRASSFDDRLVEVKGGATLSHVWVDGARGNPDNRDTSRDNVMTYGGTGTTVTADRITDSQGPSNLYLLGSFDGYPCASETVSDNLITAYASDHFQNSDWTDGISDSCENATISGNQVVDATDVAIVQYRITTDVTQRSVVKGNQVLSAGNSMYGGLGLDPLYEGQGSAPKTYDFTGAAITGNTMWSGPDTHFEIGIANGTRAWFAGTYPTNTGTGGSITGNTTGSLTARVATGVATGGMLDTTVSGNTMSFAHVSVGRCPQDDYAAEITAGYASGTFDPTPADVGFDGCV
jgi:uncharacterized protein DUF4214